MQLYGANSMSGIVVDVGYGSTDITPIVEGEICSYGVMNVPIGIRHCELYLSYILRRLTNILYSLNTPTQLSPSDLDAAILALVRQAWSDGLIQPPFTEGASSSVIAASTDESAGMEDIAAILVAGKEKALIEAANARKNTTAQAKKAAASAAEKERAALDLVDVKFSFTPKSTPDLLEEKSITVTLGKERHQFCEPLFDPLLLLRLGSDVHHEDRTRVSNQSMGIPEAIRQAAAAVTLSNRTSVWSGIFLTGDASVKRTFKCLLLRSSFPQSFKRSECIPFSPRDSTCITVDRFLIERPGEPDADATYFHEDAKDTRVFRGIS
jgi:actin-related protein 9